MSSSAQAFPTRLPIAETLPAELWERIVHFTIAREDAFLGPPTEILIFCLVCQSINRAVCFDNNSSLYARLFCFKFDYYAPLRRLGREWLNTRSVAREFKKRVVALKQVRRRECSVQDLWTCYLMMLENDGRNERQLVEWAHLYGFLKHETCLRFQADISSQNNWFQNIEVTSLLLWLWWMTFSRDDLRIENSHVRESLVCRLLHTFIVTNFRYPSFYGPESHLLIPLAPETAHSAWSSSPSTPVRVVDHYSRRLGLATPLLSLASLLVWTVRLETIRENIGFDRAALSFLPPDRETATALRSQGPTQADALKFHELQVQAPSRCSAVMHTSFDEQFMEPEYEETALPGTQQHSPRSRRYDTDWFRSVACSDPLAGPTLTSKRVYWRGSLAGPWEGFFVQTSLDAHMALVIDHDHIASESTAIYRHPLCFTLQEHHCMHPDVPITPGNDCVGGNDVLNAWLPQGLRIKQFEDEIEVFDPITQRSVRYQTFGPKQRSKKAPNVSRSARANPHLEDGLNDILVTGKTEEGHGEAWGHYVFVGRVRLWDGLVVLLRTPRDLDRADLGRWIFRGYLHDRNLVGHWRETSTPAKLVGYQGGFVARINKKGTPLLATS